jgi:hypothetical protein
MTDLTQLAGKVAVVTAASVVAVDRPGASF